MELCYHSAELGQNGLGLLIYFFARIHISVFPQLFLKYPFVQLLSNLFFLFKANDKLSLPNHFDSG